MTISRRNALAAMAASMLVPAAVLRAMPPLGVQFTDDQLGAGRRFLDKYPSIDIHAHPGRFYLRDVGELTPRLAAYGAPFEAKSVAAMRTGQLSAALFSAVADTVLLDVSSTGGLVATRGFAPGEAWREYQRQVRVLHGLENGAGLAHGRSVADVASARKKGRTACILSVEGGDFLEEDLDRVHQAYADGVRCITIVHYTINQIGDIQTVAPRHGGLTPLGARIVREMNRTGILVDVAHATLAVTRGAIDVADRPMLLSHSNLSADEAPGSRTISAEHAKLVSSHGGVIGSVPWGWAQANFAAWIDSILRLVDVVGIDAVAIGTDMDSTFNPVFDDYAQWALIPTALLARGMGETEVAKILGGNFLRVFAQANSAANISKASRPAT